MYEIINHIIKEEIYFHFSKSWGHGGQNVNKRETKAQLFFNLHDSKLTDEQKERIIELAGHQIHHHEWILIMSCQEERFQKANKDKVIHHFRQLLEQAIPEQKERNYTNIPFHQKQKRYVDKSRQSQKKQFRQDKIQLDND